jgi:hypothetical protein
MSDFYESKRLRQKIAAWSDDSLSDARALVATYAELIPRDWTSAQLYSLQNVVRSFQNFTQVELFLKNQAAKAERAGRQNVQACWQALLSKLSSYRDDAIHIVREVVPQGLDRESRLNDVYRQLLLRFVQHLIAESLALTKAAKR